MLSPHTKKPDRGSARTLFVIIGSMVILGQLAAMAVLTDGEVKKAESRKSQLTTRRVALAQCFENTFGAAESSCAREFNNGDSGVMASSIQPDNTAMAKAPKMIDPGGEGTLPIAFTPN